VASPQLKDKRYSLTTKENVSRSLLQKRMSQEVRR
jgi:hypothetical protein